MNHLIKLSSLNVVRSLRHSQSPAPTLRTVTTYTVSSSPFLDDIKYFRNHETAPEDPPMINWGVQTVPERMAFVIERLGKYHTTLRSGIHFLIPFVDRIAFVHSLREEFFDVPQQTAITFDNVRIQVNGVIYLKIEDPHLASYGAARPFDAAIHAAQGTMRSAIRKLTLDNVLKERENLNDEIVRVVNETATTYGLKCIRYVLKDVTANLTKRQLMKM